MHAAITSAANPRIRAASRLRDRRERTRSGLTLVDGVREVLRALDAGVQVVEAYVSDVLGDRDAGAVLLARLAAAGVRHTVIGDAALDRLAFGDRNEGIVAIVRVPPVGLDRLRLPADPLVVVAEGVEKPGNLGAILRTADGAGADAVIAADPRTDAFNPNAIRASLGTIFAVPVAAASSEDAFGWLRARGIRPVAAVVDAPAAYWDADLTGPVAIVLGSEAEGVGEVWRVDGVERVSIPMAGAADSLNVSVAAAVIVFEARRQRSARMGGRDG